MGGTTVKLESTSAGNDGRRERIRLYGDRRNRLQPPKKHAVCWNVPGRIKIPPPPKKKEKRSSRSQIFLPNGNVTPQNTDNIQDDNHIHLKKKKNYYLAGREREVTNE